MNGKFYATAKRSKLVGPMGEQTWPDYLGDRQSQGAAFDAMVALTGVDLAGPAEHRASA